MMSENIGVCMGGELLKGTSSIDLEEFKGIMNAAGAAEPMEIMNTKQPKDITITQVSNGYIVRVGCKAFVFESTEKMMNEISGYLKYPEMTEKAFHEDKLFDFQKRK